ncbi:hypothetical protein [Rhodoferax koreensis]|uniref:hypothetical protein n=1 Tax=Rhodoferax koreensis TaxID=1842727 RepID=UPI0012FF9C25|nr:hypothetical protein [Rhodoferax koreense]
MFAPVMYGLVSDRDEKNCAFTAHRFFISHPTTEIAAKLKGLTLVESASMQIRREFLGEVGVIQGLSRARSHDFGLGFALV